jgi:hypothetical protein
MFNKSACNILTFETESTLTVAAGSPYLHIHNFKPFCKAAGPKPHLTKVTTTDHL